MENQISKLPNFPLIVEEKFSEFIANPRRTEEAQAFQKAFTKNSNLARLIAGTMKFSAERYIATIDQGTFANEEEFLDTISARGVSGPLMDFLYFGYLVGKSVGTQESLESMLGANGAVN